MYLRRVKIIGAQNLFYLNTRNIRRSQYFKENAEPFNDFFTKLSVLKQKIQKWDILYMRKLRKIEETETF